MTGLRNTRYISTARVTENYVEMRSGEENVDSMFEIQLEEKAQERTGLRQVVCGLLGGNFTL